MPMPSFDVIVIGGGTNGLACAARLQKAGRRVLLLEAGQTPGGGAVGHEFAPGYRAPGLAHLVNMIDARVEREMDLGGHGLSYASLGMASTAVSPDGDHLVLEGAQGENVRGLSQSEGRAWAELRTQLLAFAGVLGPFKAMTPPRIAAGAGNEYMKLGKLGFGIRGMGKDNFREFLRMFLINVYDVLNDELTDPRLKGILAFENDPDRFVVQGIHMIIEGDHQRPWREGEERRSRLVFIGRKLDRQKLESGFKACLA